MAIRVGPYLSGPILDVCVIIPLSQWFHYQASALMKVDGQNNLVEFI